MTFCSTSNSTAIVGLGNLLLKDDGIGVHAIHELQTVPPAGVSLVDVGTAILACLDSIANMARVLVLDAVASGRKPGSLCMFHLSSAREEPRGASIHSLGLLSAIRLLPQNERPHDLLVLGVEPAEICYGTTLSPAVAEALPLLTSTVRSIVGQWPSLDTSGNNL